MLDPGARILEAACYILDPGSRSMIPDQGCCAHDPRSSILAQDPGPGSWIMNPGCWMLNPGSWSQDHATSVLHPSIQDQWSQIKDAAYMIQAPASWPRILDLDPGPWMQDAGSWILDAGAWILDPRSWILDTGSRMHDLGSRIKRPGCWAGASNQDHGSRIQGPRYTEATVSIPAASDFVSWFYKKVNCKQKRDLCAWWKQWSDW